MLPSSLSALTIHDDAEIKELKPETKPASEALTCEPGPAARSMEEPILPLPMSANRDKVFSSPAELLSYAYDHRSRWNGRGRGNALSDYQGYRADDDENIDYSKLYPRAEYTEEEDGELS